MIRPARPEDADSVAPLLILGMGHIAGIFARSDNQADAIPFFRDFGSRRRRDQVDALPAKGRLKGLANKMAARIESKMKSANLVDAVLMAGGLSLIAASFLIGLILRLSQTAS